MDSHTSSQRWESDSPTTADRRDFYRAVSVISADREALRCDQQPAEGVAMDSHRVRRALWCCACQWVVGGSTCFTSAVFRQKRASDTAFVDLNRTESQLTNHPVCILLLYASCVVSLCVNSWSHQTRFEVASLS